MLSLSPFHRWENWIPETLGYFPVIAAAAKLLQSCLTLCDPIDGSPPGFPVPGILQARTLEWVAITFSHAWKKSESEVTQLCLILCDPMDCSPLGSSIHGILQARVLEWIAIAFSLWRVRIWILANSFPSRFQCNGLLLDKTEYYDGIINLKPQF